MGIDLEIRKYLLERHKGLCSQEPIQRRVGSDGAQWVEIEAVARAPAAAAGADMLQDVLTRLHSLMGPSYNFVFTGDQLVEAILEPALQLLSLPSASVRTYVLCADEPSRVPREKAAEQKRRLEPDRTTRRRIATDPEAAEAESKAKRRKPAEVATTWKDRRKSERADLERVYPPDARVVSGGIEYRRSVVGMDGTRGDLIVEPLHLPSLLRERRARTSIWDYLLQFLKSAVCACVLPPSVTATQNPFAMTSGELIVDHFVTGPWRFAADAPDGEVLTDLCHPFGEGEVMCMFWANYYAKFPRVIHSIDTDVMPLAVHMLTISNVEAGGALLWKYNSKVHMDLRLLVDVLYCK